MIQARRVHRRALVLCAGALLSAGCIGNLPKISDRATITVWRSKPGRGLRTGAEVVAADLQKGRQLFLRFYRRTLQVGTEDPVELERRLDAHGLMFVQFREPGRPLVELHVLKDRSGNPLSTGHGPVEVFAREMRSPTYRYFRRDVLALKKWLDEQTPKRPPPPPGLQ